MVFFDFIFEVIPSSYYRGGGGMIHGRGWNLIGSFIYGQHFLMHNHKFYKSEEE